jgi:hypothetical protein
VGDTPEHRFAAGEIRVVPISLRAIEGAVVVTVAVTYDEPSTFLVLASGDVTAEDMHFVLRQILSHREFRAGARILIDARSMVGAPPIEELRTVARELTPLLDRGLRAMAIVAETQYIYGIARTFSAYAEPLGVNVAPFRDLEGAQRWLAALPPERRPTNGSSRDSTRREPRP